MIFYSVGKRVKDFVKVILNPAALRRIESGRSGGKSYERKVLKYPDGKVKGELVYVNGKLNGISTMYYETGRIKSRETYKEGVLDGPSKYYFENGRLMREEFYRKENLIFKRIFTLDGTVTSETRY